MASLRLSVANSFLKKINSISTNSIIVVARREIHILPRKRWIDYGSYYTRRKIFYDERSTFPLRHSYMFEHTSSGLYSLDSQNVSEKVNLTDGEQSPITTAVPDSSKEIEGLSTINESVLPPIPTPIEEISEIGRDSLSAYGLGSITPSGIIQQILECYQVYFGLPWWGAIISLTITLRLIFLPMNIMVKRNMIHYQNVMQELHTLQEKMTEARRRGSYYDVVKCSIELKNLSLHDHINPLKMYLPQFYQVPVFLSVYFGLNGLAKSGMESFQKGGILWFVDLSTPDQYYLLPVITGLTVAAVMKLSGVGQMSPSPLLSKSLPIGAGALIGLFCINFPTGVLCYWTATNFFTLIQTYILNIPRVKEYCKIPTAKVIVKPKAEGPKLSFFQQWKNSYENMRITAELSNREHYTAKQFEQAGSAPLQRTFKRKPNEARSVSSAASTVEDEKKRSAQKHNTDA